MSYFKAKIHQIRFRLGICPTPRWGSSQAHSAPPDHFVVSKNSAARRLTDILLCGPHPQMNLRPL